ncbi:MAG TPA: fumarylacetoacetate hydrolase family protein [Burkholderiaceae bacterium]|nr:fumarylacetoacetate hydrolase family protein [Burkholderiaceae bacterium]
MKLLRHGPRGHERPGLVDADGRLRDLSAQIGDITPADLAHDRLGRLRHLDPYALPELPPGTRLGVPWHGLGKFVCVGLNYRDHAAESNLALPTEPVLFLKAGSALTGPGDPIVLPRGSVKTDWEVELGVVIGHRARYVEEAAALSHVAGYCVVHDVSERAYQLERGGTWDKGKGCDTFGPVGPWLVTADEVPDPQALRLTLHVNGERMQDGSTGDMVFGVAALVSYISRFMTLEPGDLIATGTPAGVGMGRKPQRFLKPGDGVRVAIEGLGEQDTVICEWDASLLD